MASSTRYADIEYFAVSFPAPFVAHIEIVRPEKLNAIAPGMWNNMKAVFERVSDDPDVRCVIFSGRGDRAFTAGLDVQSASTEGPIASSSSDMDVARRATLLRRHIAHYQSCVTAIEKCEKPVITILHGYCYGAAIDFSTAADIRYASQDAKLCVKEVDIGLAADVGTLSRLQKVGVSYSWVKDVCFTARIFGAEEAARVGLVSNVFADKRAALEGALATAKLIASKSPVAVQGTKALLDFSRDHTVAVGLEQTATWNAAMLQTDDVTKAMLSGLQKTRPTFEKL